MTAPMISPSASPVKVFRITLYRSDFSPLTVRILSDSELSAICTFRSFVFCPRDAFLIVTAYPFQPPMAFDHSTLSDRSFALLG